MLTVPSRYRLGPKTSDWAIAVFLTATLFLRLVLEPSLRGFWLVSLFIGVLPLVFLWALIRNRVLNPSFFGLWRPADRKVGQ